MSFSCDLLQDAWLDSVEVDTKLAQRGFTVTLVKDNVEEDTDDELSSEEIGTIKRRIADALEPGETVNCHSFCPPYFCGRISEVAYPVYSLRLAFKLAVFL